MLLKKAIETSEHAKSYYAASAVWETDYPQLEADLQVDVVIIGGGFSGISTAVELSERGFKVALVEANRISWGASGRNGGQVIGGVGHNPDKFRRTIGSDGVKAVYQMGEECVDILKNRIEKYNIDCDLKWGYCEAALRPRHLRAYQRWAEEDENMTLLDRSQLKDYINSDIYLGGYYKSDWGHLHPLNLCIGEAKVAADLGTKIFEQSAVTKITYGDNPAVHTEKGSIKADYVVVCGNAYLGKLIPYLDNRVLPSTSCIVATEPLSDEQVEQTLRRDVAVCDSRTALDYYRLSADKRMLFGGLSNYTGLEPKNVTEIMRAKMINVFPSLKDTAIDYTWSGQMAVSIRRIPQMGRLDGNVLYVGGYSGHGVAPTHVMGRLIAEAIDGNSERFDIMSKIFHYPWPGGKLLRRPAMAAGMMFYKIMDLV